MLVPTVPYQFDNSVVEIGKLLWCDHIVVLDLSTDDERRDVDSVIYPIFFYYRREDKARLPRVRTARGRDDGLGSAIVHDLRARRR